MHELSIVESLLDVVLESADKARATKVIRIHVVVGDLSGVVDDYMSLYFNFLSEKTIAHGAEIVFTHKPARLRCRPCNVDFSPEGSDFGCPRCKEQQVDIIGGRELYVDEMEVE